MNKTTYTPWHRNIPPARKYCTVYAGRNTHICYLDGQVMSDEKAEANINLICAAPDLLEALKRALPILEEEQGVMERSFLPEPLSENEEDLLTNYEEAVKMVRAAIAKAEGK